MLNYMNPTPLSQRYPQWSSKILGQSSTTIGSHGCTISVIAMKFGLTPVYVNDRLNAVNGYASTEKYPAEKNLVIWKKLEEALPGVKFAQRYYVYNNQAVLDNLPCLVEVDGTPIGGTRHWVLFIGNQKLIDPWDGQIKSTATYTPLGVVVLQGVPLSKEVVTGSETYKGLDLTNRESIKVAIDTWKDVADGKYVRTEIYEHDIESAKTTNQKLSDQEGVSLKAYYDMKALGYTTVNDITKKFEEANKTIVALTTENKKLLNRVSMLAGEIQDIAQEDHTTAELGEKALDENKQLKEELLEIGRLVGVRESTMKNIGSSIIRIKELADRFIKVLEEQDRRNKQTKPEVTVTANQEVKKDVNWLISFLKPNQDKEVK